MKGVGPEDTAGATLMEKVINLHCAKTKVPLNLHTLFRDASAYGLGIVTPQWIVWRGRKRRTSSMSNTLVDENNNTVRVGMASSASTTSENVILFEGNGLDNIDPYCYLPDPNVPIHNVQRGEYVGWLDRDNFLNLLADEELDGDLFNVQYLRRCVSKFTSVYGSSSYPRQSRNHLGNNQFTSLYSAPIDLLHMYVKLIPSVWDLGDNEYPEKWMFTVGADSVIIRANKLELDHDLYPICVTYQNLTDIHPLAFLVWKYSKVCKQ